MFICGFKRLCIILLAVLLGAAFLHAETGSGAWLRYAALEAGAVRQYREALPDVLTALGDSILVQSAREELVRGVRGMLGRTLRVESRAPHEGAVVLGTLSQIRQAFPQTPLSGDLPPDGFLLKTVRLNGARHVMVAGANERGVLYGVFALLRKIAWGESIADLDEKQSPYAPVRWINQWDNLDGTIERGYGGRSIFWENGRARDDLGRAGDYGRLLASLGINGCSLNNVNANPRILASDFLPQVARIADALRPWGVRAALAVDLGSPKTLGGLDTFDPLDPRVIAWWKSKADEVYRAVPDLGGFVVKADSEGRVGPSAYGRTHADAANVVARALKPHGGLLFYRGFVYDHHMDWRNLKNDRARAAYENFHPLDGRFDDNVVIQIKNGPIDFQVREPASPLFGALEKTNQAIELQITQEYMGQARHLVFLVPQWKETLDFDLHARGPGSTVKALAAGKTFQRPAGGFVGVANVGLDQNWMGNHSSQANLYGFGRLAWDPDLSAARIAEEWTRLTFGSDPAVVKTIVGMQLESWRAYENYTGPLGLQTLTDIVGNHFGVAVEASERNGWGQWHRADERGVGMDRTVATGTGFIGQYRPAVARMYESLASCPDVLLVFMHHVPYTHVLHSGTTVIQFIYDSHYEGAEAVNGWVSAWKSLQGRVDDQRFNQVLAQLEYQAGQAQVWRDAVTSWFLKASGIPDAKGRVGRYPGRFEAEAMRLEGYTATNVTPWETASGGQAVECKAARCAATLRYDGAPGRHTLRVRYFDQNNGVSRFRLWLAGRLVAEWAADDRLPTRKLDGSSSSRRTISGIALRPGDEIRIEGLPDGGETAALDYVEIEPEVPAVWKDPDAPLEQRVDDLLSRLTLEEKISQLMSDSPAIERLGVPAYNWWNECLHGVARAGRATVFPQAIGLAATWDTRLIGRVATAISDEARAKHHEFVRRGKRNIYQGLTFWTPNINLFRDPRWGRGMETYGEDPYLTGRLAVAFIKGLQGDDPKYLKTVATAKHYAVHSGPEPLRHTFDAVVDAQDLRETYLPQFEAAVKEGGAESVMCAYNRVDGRPACASEPLLAGILRKRWGFPGYVVSDCGAIGDIYLNHKVAPNAEQGVAQALKAGTDLNCGVEYAHLLPAVRQGLLAEPDIDNALRRLLRARFKLGLFDPPERIRYAQIPYALNDSPAHRELALETARKSIVLLKNEGGILPLEKSLKTLAVIGPNADAPDVLLGNYNGDPTEVITPLEGIRRKVGPGVRVLYARGSDLAPNLPAFEVVPASALFTSNGPERRNGLRAEYFPYSNFDGKVHRPRELTYPSSGRVVGEIPADPKPLFTRVDQRVDFHWWDGAPREDLNDDDFGVRWTGFLSAPASGAYQLGAIGMNAFELYFDGKPLVQFNGIHEAAYRYETVKLEAGKLYPIRLDFHEYLNDARIQLVWSRPGGSHLAEALAAAKDADAVVLVLGLSPRLEGEEMKVPVEGFQGGDRVELGIPRVQEELMKTIADLGKPVVLVLLNGSALAVNWARDHMPAIVEAWYPGQAGGAALADVLFGDYNPAGRLPVTFYRSAEHLPPFTDYRMKGRTYRFFEGQPLYPFGYGLSYTIFAYSNLNLPKNVRTGEPVKVSVEVENTGAIAGEEVVQLYVKAVRPAWRAPLRSLAGFERLALRPGERKKVEFTLSPRQFSHVTAKGQRLAEPGTYEISVGGKQPGFRGLLDAATTGVVTASVEIRGAARQLDGP